MIDIDAKDRQILGQLQADGRMSNTDLADRVHLSQSACLRRVRRLEAEGVLAGYVALVDAAAIGRPVNVFVEITLSGQSEDVLDAFEAAVRDCEEVMFCHLMSGDTDYLLHVVAADTEDYARIHRSHLARFPGVARIQTSFALRTISRKSAYPL